MDKDNNAYFLISKEEMLAELFRSKESGCVLGILSVVLGQGIFLCHVKEVWMDEDEEDVVVLFHENAFTGVCPDVHTLYLHEIERIYSFKVYDTSVSFRQREGNTVKTGH
jgi:hypothetical protein